MRWTLLFALPFLIGGCAQQESPAVKYVNREDDPLYREIKRNVDALGACYQREAISPSLKNVDIETAALAVFGRCVSERQRHKTFSASHTIESPPQFEQRWRAEEQNDILHIKQLLAVVRTSH